MAICGRMHPSYPVYLHVLTTIISCLSKEEHKTMKITAKAMKIIADFKIGMSTHQ